jgi:hypothetical protein
MAAQQVNGARSLREPDEDRLPLDHPRRSDVLAEHDRALESGAAGYRDPASGFFVMTAAYLAAQGACCGNGCRHCPYC